MARLLALLALLLTLGRPARADDIGPVLRSVDLTDCEGQFTHLNSLVTSTGTPDVRFVFQDPGSGFVIAQGSNSGGTAGPSGRLLHLRFDGVVSDSSTITHSLTSNSIDVIPVASGNCQGEQGDCAQWNANGDYIKYASSQVFSAINSNRQLTIQAWIRPDSVATPQPIFEWSDDPAGTVGVRFWLGKPPSDPGGAVAGSVLYANMVDTTTANHPISAPGSAVQPGQWQLVTLTYISAGNKGVAELWLNEVLAASGTVISTSAFQPLLVSTNGFVGRSVEDNVSFLGYMDEVRVFSRVLTAGEIIAQSYSGKFRFTTNASTGPYTTRNLAAGDFSTGEGSQAEASARTNAVPLIPGGNENHIEFYLRDFAGNALGLTAQRVTVQTSPPDVPPGLQGVATSTGSILWTWTKPARLACSQGLYRFYRASDDTEIFQSGLAAFPGPATSFHQGSGLSANVKAGGKVRGESQAFGQSSLSGAVEVYTAALPPVALQAPTVQADQMTVSWNNNTNPGYTRWEVSYALDAGFTVGLSTPVQIVDNHTALNTTLTGLQASTTYYVRVRAFNGSGSDFAVLGATFSAFATGAFPTLPSAASNLRAVAASPTSVTWSWDPVQTATGYTLLGPNGGVSTPGTSVTVGGLSVNTLYSATLITHNLSGSSAQTGAASAYTQANPPTGTAVTASSTGSITLAWGVNGNPAGTIFEVQFGTSPAFDLLVSTRNTNAAGITLGGLLPGTTYHIRVRALNFDLVPTAYDAAVQRVTDGLSAVSAAQLPLSPYRPAGETLVWHLDEGAGTTALDSSGFGNNGSLVCTFVGCSTPTYTSSFSGMGSAVSFTGVQNAYCRVANSASLGQAGSVTVEAWVRPSRLNQTNGAAIAAKGDGLPQDGLFALDVENAGVPRYRFLVRTTAGTAVAVATSTIRVGAWTHVAGVYDTSGAGTVKIFVDGVLSNTTPAAGNTRNANAHEFTVGARQSAAADYDRAFAGDIDDVHVFARPLSDADVAARYASARPSTLDLPSPNAQVRLIIPADSFPDSGDVLASSSPASSPIRAIPAAVRDGANSPPQGYYLIPGSLVEIVPSVGGQPLTSNLASPVTLSLSYSDSDGNGIVDGTQPPVAAQDLRIFTLNETVVRWDQLTSTVDLANRRVEAPVPHFSVFALFGTSGVQADTAQVRVYPVPWKPGSGGRFDSAVFGSRSGLVFDNLPESGVVRILTLSGELVREIPFGSTDLGVAVWDGRNHAGRDAASGVYLAYIKPVDGAVTIRKLAIER